MTVSLLLAALITFATLWFIVRPLRSRASAAPARENEEGLVQLRDRLLAQLRELDVEMGDRNVDATVAADERRRLEAELAPVLARLEGSAPAHAPAAAPPSSPRSAFAAVIALVLAVPLAAAGLYFVQNRTVLAQLEQARALAGRGVPPMVLEMVARLERRLVAEPDDPQGWARLGRAYAVLGRAADARQAYTRALALAPDDTGIVNAYAGFLLAMSPGRPSPEAVALFRKLHAADPDHPGALWALGIVAYQNEEFDHAVTYWERLLDQLPVESEITTELRRALDVARAHATQRQ